MDRNLSSKLLARGDLIMSVEYVRNNWEYQPSLFWADDSEFSLRPLALSALVLVGAVIGIMNWL